MIKLFLIVVIFITLIKMSFIKSYVSTDFEVHRNWLAITNNLHIKYWYFDNTSKWTLDYPPLFAWFEYGLSKLAEKFDCNMTKLENIDYISDNAKIFHKLSVIFSDLIYVVSVFKILSCKPISKLLHNSLFNTLTSIKLLGPFGLLLIDHIHFQYNGMLFGFLFLSIYNLMKNRELWAAFWFTVLLNFKHIYIYYAPAYGAYLFFHYCFVTVIENDKLEKRYFSFRRFLKLGSVVLAVFLVSFGPFIIMNQLNQVISRLFPFDSRGLTHAYWAPNIWAIYNALDMTLCRTIGKFFSLPFATNEMTKGLVETYKHLILPNINPLTTLILTVSSILPSLVKCQYTKSTTDFFKLLIICGWSAFIFGWHVHEKAILMVTLPFMFLEILDRKCLAFGFYVTTISHYSLLPLIPTIPEYSLKISLFLACTCTHFVHINHMYGKDVLNTLSPIFKYHLIMLLPLWIFTDVIIPIFVPRYQFLPLMITSLFCSVGIVIGYVKFYLYYWTNDDAWVLFQKEKKISDSKKNQ